MKFPLNSNNNIKYKSKNYKTNHMNMPSPVKKYVSLHSNTNPTINYKK